VEAFLGRPFGPGPANWSPGPANWSHGAGRTRRCAGTTEGGSGRRAQTSVGGGASRSRPHRSIVSQGVPAEAALFFSKSKPATAQSLSPDGQNVCASWQSCTTGSHTLPMRTCADWRNNRLYADGHMLKRMPPKHLGRPCCSGRRVKQWHRLSLPNDLDTNRCATNVWQGNRFSVVIGPTSTATQ
jgi:hypothetical protein